MTAAIMLALAVGNEAKLTEEMIMEINEEKRAEEYRAFLARKAQLANGSGFEPLWMPDFLFDFQQFLTTWTLRMGRAANFQDCGLGKTIQQLVCAENVIRKTNGKVLLLTPLAVSAQTAQEAEKFGIEASVSRDGKPSKNITITNYERLHHFNPDDYVGVVCDESSILKNFQGKTKSLVTEFMRQIQYRTLWTATAAPNDYTELGTSSEALGGLGYTDMLNRFFKNEQNNSGIGRMYGQARTWRFKGHSEEPFWRWMASWARAMRKPSDFGFDDSRFALPELIERTHVVKARTIADGWLFEVPAVGMDEERAEARRTIKERCEKATELAQTGKACVIYCNLNDESELLAKLLPDFVNVKAKTSEADMRQREEVFAGFSSGQIRGLVIKPKVGALGLNWQHCAHAIGFPTYSYEQYYQYIRRFYRFGQTENVVSDLVTTESGAHIREAIQKKAKAADRMFSSLVEHMNQAMNIKANGLTKQQEIPSWL